jgi:hypothetical protein
MTYPSFVSGIVSRQKKLRIGEPICSFEKPTLDLYGSAGCFAKKARNRPCLARTLAFRANAVCWSSGTRWRAVGSFACEHRPRVEQARTRFRCDLSPIVSSREREQWDNLLHRRFFTGTFAPASRRQWKLSVQSDCPPASFANFLSDLKRIQRP